MPGRRKLCTKTKVSRRPTQPVSVCLIETIEYARKVLGRNSDARVCNLQQNLAGFASGAQLNPARGGRKFDGVVYKDKNQSPQRASIAAGIAAATRTATSQKWNRIAICSSVYLKNA
jgi:hypothetical protein